MAKTQKAKISGGRTSRQRNKPAQVRYTAKKRWIGNKIRKLKKYLRRHPNWNPGNLSSEVAQALGLGVQSVVKSKKGRVRKYEPVK